MEYFCSFTIYLQHICNICIFFLSKTAAKYLQVMFTILQVTKVKNLLVQHTQFKVRSPWHHENTWRQHPKDLMRQNSGINQAPFEWILLRIKSSHWKLWNRPYQHPNSEQQFCTAFLISIGSTFSIIIFQFSSFDSSKLTKTSHYFGMPFVST